MKTFSRELINSKYCSYIFKVLKYLFAYRISISLLIITYQIFLRVFITNSILWFVIPIIIITFEALRVSYRYSQNLLNYFSRHQIICIILLSISLLFTFLKQSDNQYYSNIFVLFTYPLMFSNSILLFRFCMRNYYNRELLSWISFSYVFDSIYIFLEGFAEQINYLPLTIFLKKPFVDGILSGRFQESIFSTSSDTKYFELSGFLGPRGFPEFTIPFFTICSVILINLSLKKENFVASYFLIVNSLIILAFSKVTLLFVFFVVYLIYKFRPLKMRYLLKRNFYFLLIFLIFTSFLISFNKLAFVELLTRFESIFMGKDSRLNLIIDLSNTFQVFSRMNLFEFIFGTGDVSKLRLSNLLMENEIINIIYTYGFIFFASLTYLNFQTIILYIRNSHLINLNKNRNQFVISCSIITLFIVEGLHFGRFFSMPDISIIAFLTGTLNQFLNEINYKNPSLLDK